MKRIVVGLDGSPPSFGALRWSAGLASRLDLDLVAAWAWLPGVVELDPAAAGALSETAERGLESWCAAARPAVTPELVMIQGDAARSLLAVAADRHADLLVVGPRGTGGIGGIRFGSVTRELAHRTSLPLGIVPLEAEDHPMRHVVLGVDGSEGSLAAADYCAGLAGPLDVPVTAVLASDPLLEWLPAHDSHGWRRQAEKHVDAWVAPLHAAGVTVHVVVDRDVHPAAALARVLLAQEGALAVVGARHVGGLAGLRRGRLPLQLVRQAEVPVVVVASVHAGRPVAAGEDPGGA